MASIAIVSSSYYPVMGGVSEHVHALAEELARRGHGVTILTGPYGRPRGDESSGQRGLASGDARGDTRNAGTLLGDGPRRSAGIDVVRVGTSRALTFNGGTVTLVGEPGLARGLAVFAPEAFDMVHVHSPCEPLLPMAAVQYFKCPVVATFHSHGRSAFGYRLFRPVLAPLLRRLDARIAVSTTAAQFISEAFPGSYQVIPNGVDIGRFSSPSRFDPKVETSSFEAQSCHRLLSVGRLDARKGLDTILRAAGQLQSAAAGEKRGGRWELDIVGDGPQRGALQKLARELGLCVRFRGAVQVEHLAACYARADAFLAAATYGESFGVVLLEAMAAGLPIVASDLRSFRDVLGDSGAGRLFEAGNPSSLAQALRDVFADEETRRRMGERGRTHAASFGWVAVVDRIESVYRAVAGESGASLFPERYSTVQVLPARKSEAKSPSPFFEMA